MRTVTISDFKATCLALLDEVCKTGEPILITRRGEPVAQVQPPPKEGKRGLLGRGKGTCQILGDLIEPVMDEAWECEKGDPQP